MNIRRFAIVLALFAGIVSIANAQDNKHPLAGAKEGEWAIHKSVISYTGGSMTQNNLTFVSKVDGTKVTVSTQSLKDDLKTGNSPATPVTIDTAPPKAAPEGEKKDGPKPTMSEEEVEVKGKKIKCQKVEMTIDTPTGKMTSSSWSSPDAPVWHQVKSITKDKDGKETMHIELVDYGTSGGAEKPLN